MKNFKLQLIATQILLLLSSGSPALAQTKKVISVGGHFDFSASPSATVRVSDRKILRAADLKSKVRAVGLKPGHARLDIGPRHYEIEVVPQLSSPFQTSARRLLKNKLGLSIASEKHPLTLEGSLHRLSDYLEIIEFAERKKIMLRFRAQFDRDIQDAAKSYFQNYFSDRNWPIPEIAFDPVLRLTFSEKARRDVQAFAEQIQAFGAQIEFEKDQLQVKPLVKMRIVVAEVSRLLQKKIGVTWPTSLTAQVSPESNLDPLRLTLHAIEDEGLGQILASPTLLTRSGGDADFLAGGEIPIRSSSYRRSEVIWKRYGILLKMKPKTDSSGRLQIELSVEVSTLDGSAIEGIPAIKTNKISTQFDLKKAETIVLSGMVKNESVKSTAGLPGLKSIPIFGALFSSRSFLNSQTELIIFVTPEVIQQ